MTLYHSYPRADTCYKDYEKIDKKLPRVIRPKSKTYNVDFSYIENPHNPINDFQKKVLRAECEMSTNVKDEIQRQLDLGELVKVLRIGIAKVLTGRQKEAVYLSQIQELSQIETASMMGVTQPRVNFLVKKGCRKLKIFFLAQGYTVKEISQILF